MADVYVPTNHPPLPFCCPVIDFIDFDLPNPLAGNISICGMP
jgi:hypothetical protein